MKIQFSNQKRPNITLNFPSHALGANAMAHKGNVVLYLDRELVEKSKELGFNSSRTFENYLKHLLTHFSTVNSANNFEPTENKVFDTGLPKLTALELNEYHPLYVFLRAVGGARSKQ